MNAIVRTTVVVDIRVEDVGGISNTALSIRVVLARTPLPDLSIIDVSFARRVSEAQESARKDGDRILVVGDTREPASEFTIDVVGEVLVPDLPRNVRPPFLTIEVSTSQHALVEVRNRSR